MNPSVYNIFICFGIALFPEFGDPKIHQKSFKNLTSHFMLPSTREFVKGHLTTTWHTYSSWKSQQYIFHLEDQYQIERRSQSYFLPQCNSWIAGTILVSLFLTVPFHSSSTGNVCVCVCVNAMHSILT